MENKKKNDNNPQNGEYNYKSELEQIVDEIENPYPLLDEEWFRKYGITDPSTAAEKFRDWYNKLKNTHLDHKNPHHHINYLKEVLHCGTGLAEPTCDAYLRGQTYWEERIGGKNKIGRKKIICLNTLTTALGYPKPLWNLPERKNSKNRNIAILAELTGIPSEGYHFELIRKITEIAEEHKYEASLHPIHQNSIQEDLIKFMYTFDPYAIIMIRLSPKDFSCLETVPTILIHADKKRYTYPSVICNIIPDHSTIKTSLKKWADQVLNSGRSKNTEVVVVSVEEEYKDGSIRDERILLIIQALKHISSNVKIHHCIVSDYSFRHSIKIFNRYKDNAKLFICLSDPLAICIKHLLIATGKNYKHRVCGFDFSNIAQAENITSFDQGLSEIALQAFKKLQEYESGKHQFEEINIKVKLISENPKRYPNLNEIEVVKI